MSIHSGQQIVILPTTWWWQNLVSKQTIHRVHMERFNLKKLNEVEGKKKYHIEISNGFLALENFFFIWFVRLLALRPLLAYCASLG
jgi:hypothetical protein